MQRLADGTRAGKQLAHHAFYLFTQTGLVEVKTKDIPSGV